MPSPSMSEDIASNILTAYRFLSRVRHRIAGTLTAEEHLKLLADVVARLNALQEELKALEGRIASQRLLVAEDIAFIQQQRDRLNDLTR